MTAEYISENTSLMANQNQHVKQYNLTRKDINFALLAKALHDYEYLLQFLDEKFYLEQMQREQNAEADRLKKEQIDLRLRLDAAQEQSLISFNEAQETSSKSAE